MARPKQTGLSGRPAEPFVISFSVVGAHDASGPDLRQQAQGLRERIDAIRAEMLADGSWRVESWGLLRVTPDGRQRSWHFEDGVIDEARWEEAVEGVHGNYRLAELSAVSSGAVVLEAPDYGFFGSDVRSLSAYVRAPEARADWVAAALVDELRSVSDSRVQTGFVHCDSIADPYTRVVTSYSRLCADDFSAEVHGYYWAVLLTGGHLERLGGSKRVREESPCATVESVKVGDADGVLCVLSESPLDMSEQLVREWRDFLAPLRRPGYPGYRENLGKADTGRPLWLFEGELVPGGTTFVLSRGDDSEGPPLEVVWSGVVQDPERPTFWLYPTEGFDPEHAAVVDAVVNAWYVTGLQGKLAGVEGSLSWSSEVTWDTDDDGRRAMVWQVDFGTCTTIEEPVERLVAALSELDEALRGEAKSMFERLVIA